MPLGHHTDPWFENQNKALGLPPGTRHHDEWYQREIGRRQAQAEEQSRYQKEQQAKEPQYQISQQQSAANFAANQAANRPPTPPTGPTAAELAAKEAKRQADMRARRDEWDRLNNQGIHDPDGWQSIGFQPDPVAMPSWWLDGLELGTTAPAVPLPIPPVVPPPVVPQVTPAVIPPAEEQKSAAPPTNALSLFGTGGQAQSRTAQPAGQSNWGAWGQQPSGQNQANPWGAGLMGMKPQPWGQKPAGQGTWGSGNWSQGQPQPWGQKPAGQMSPSWR
jgi:hypothetical protein